MPSWLPVAGLRSIGNAVFTGSDVSAGLFEGGNSLLGMPSGIVLTSGDARRADGPNTDDKFSARASQQGDAALDSALSVTTTDSSSLDFDFQFGDGTVGGDLYLNFAFASEEYNENIGTPFTDAVAVLIDEAPVDGVYRNLSLVPGAVPLTTHRLIDRFGE